MEQKNFIQKIICRLERLLLKAISASTLTWIVILIAMKNHWVTISGEAFLLFTAAVIGIKSYKDMKQIQPPTGG